MMYLHMGLFLSIVLHSRCVVFLSQETHIFQSTLTVFIDYFLPFIFSVLVFRDLNYLDVGPSGWVFLFFLPLPFPFFNLCFSLFAILIYNIIFLILNFYLGCLSLNLQGLIFVFVFFVLLLPMFFLFGDMFLFHWCSAVYYFLESNEDVFKSILFSTWSFFPLVTLTFLLEAFLR